MAKTKVVGTGKPQFSPHTKKPVISIWTDGACSNNGKPNAVGGWAFIARVTNRAGERLEKVKSGGAKEVTNNQMELQAVIEALKVLKRPSVVLLYTDSEYVAKAFLEDRIERWRENGWMTTKRTPVQNKEMWEELYDLVHNRQHNVKFRWVRGHDKDRMNKRVDELAVKAKLLA